ncbi:unnamed protein product [Linum trigynum]|uniref:Uncharacterized protein n=1 Tax=Linum trigynum TaxID=586398 RepID=A0AAV2CED9_9ROSI
MLKRNEKWVREALLCSARKRALALALETVTLEQVMNRESGAAIADSIRAGAAEVELGNGLVSSSLAEQGTAGEEVVDKGMDEGVVLTEEGVAEEESEGLAEEEEDRQGEEGGRQPSTQREP